MMSSTAAQRSRDVPSKTTLRLAGAPTWLVLARARASSSGGPMAGQRLRGEQVERLASPGAPEQSLEVVALEGLELLHDAIRPLERQESQAGDIPVVDGLSRDPPRFRVAAAGRQALIRDFINSLRGGPLRGQI